MSLPENTPAPRRRLPYVFIAIGVIVILLLTVGGAIWGGYQAGIDERQKQSQATLTVELKKQYDLGVTDLAAGHSELARQRFEYILSHDPNYPGAMQKLTEASEVLQVTPTATALPAPIVSISPTPATTGENTASVFALAQQSSAAKNWDDAIRKLSQVRALDPNYETAQVDQMMFTALRNRGVAHIDGTDLEGGIFDLNQAEAFGKLDQDASSHRIWARYYLDAQSYWGLNWPKTIQLLNDLHGFAPYFHDTAAKLREARITYAAQLSTAEKYCDAVAQYTEAQTLAPKPDTADKLSAAQAKCASAPTPGTPAAGEPTSTPKP
jgi:tetratricopeptide (TPR) repeat protein